jgi:hypothetical protein
MPNSGTTKLPVRRLTATVVIAILSRWTAAAWRGVAVAAARLALKI